MIDCLGNRVCLKMSLVVSALVMLLSLITLAPAESASAGTFNLTIAGARAAKACLPPSKIAPKATPVCFTGGSWISALPSYARSSNQRFDVCLIAAGFGLVGGVIFAFVAWDQPETYPAFYKYLQRVSDGIEFCYG